MEWGRETPRPPTGAPIGGRRFGSRYLVLATVRMHWVHTLVRIVTPLIVSVLRWTLALNFRFVRRLEKETLCPKVVVLPQSSQVPAT